MNCAEWEARVALEAGGDLAGVEAAEVERHLAECPDCRALHAGIRESLGALRAAHAGLPEAAHFTAVRGRVMAELERHARPWRWLAWTAGAAAVAALLLVSLWPARVAPLPPRMEAAARIPVAPVVAPRAEVAAVRPRARRAARRLPRIVASAPRREPLLVKFQTADPNIVIYWIAD